MSANGAPPGYAEPADNPNREPFVLPFPLAVFAAALGSTLLLSLHALCLALPRAYTFDSRSSALDTALVLVGLCAGALLARTLRHPAAHAAGALAALSLLASLSGYLFLAAFARRSALDIAALTFPTVVALLLGLASSLALRAFGPSFATLGLLEYFLNPLRAALLGASWLVALYALPLLGLLRQGALLGALLAGLGLLTPRVATLFALAAPAPQPGRALLLASPWVALASLLWAGAWLPLDAIREHAGELVYALDGPRGTHVVSKLQGGLILFSNQVVATTSTDATRFAEALVHPAFGIARERAHVLVLDDASGAVTREVLRWPGVKRVTLLPSDPALLDLARSSNAFRALGAAALDSPKVAVDRREPAVFVLTSGERFPLIVANLADPSSYLAGKYYTVRFFEAVRQRLAPDGLFALQITSPERTPRTHASILATLREAGFATLAYRAPLPTLGEWGFALATPAEGCPAGAPMGSLPAPCGAAELDLSQRIRSVQRIPPGTSLVSASTLASLFATSDAATGAVAPPNFLYDPALIETYQAEEHALSE